MRKFDFSFLDNGLVPAALVNLTGDIYAMRVAAENRRASFETVFTELEAIAKIQSVKSSNAIEGIVTSDQRIAEIVNHSSAPLDHDEAEIAGYRDALNLVHGNFLELDFCKADILGLHKKMLSPSGAEDAGKFKTSDNLIIEVDSLGRRSVRFRPIPAKETEAAMEQLELAYLDAQNNSNVNQLLLAPCVILDFLCIHPFRDGNGRMSRLLSLLLLYKNGFDAGKYISFEEQINLQKVFYYESLRESSVGWNENQNDYFPFIKNFLSMLYMCYKELDKRFAIVNGKRVSKTARIEATILESLTALSKAEICKIHPDISATTIEAVLGKMLKGGEIRKVGSGRSTRYIRN